MAHYIYGTVSGNLIFNVVFNRFSILRQSQLLVPIMPKARRTRSISSSAVDARGAAKRKQYGKDMIGRLTTEYDRNRDLTKATAAKKYMRNKFEFYGLYAPQRRAIDKLVGYTSMITCSLRVDRSVKL